MEEIGLNKKSRRRKKKRGGGGVSDAMILAHRNIGSSTIVLPIPDAPVSVSGSMRLETRERRSRIRRRRGSKMKEPNLNWNPDRYQARYL